MSKELLAPLWKARLDRLRKEGVKPVIFVCGNEFLAGTIWESRFDALVRRGAFKDRVCSS